MRNLNLMEFPIICIMYYVDSSLERKLCYLECELSHLIIAMISHANRNRKTSLIKRAKNKANSITINLINNSQVEQRQRTIPILVLQSKIF